MENGSHNNSENSKIDVTVYAKKIDHLKYMLEMKTETARLQEERIWRLEDELKNLAREKFVFLN